MSSNFALNIDACSCQLVSRCVVPLESTTYEVLQFKFSGIIHHKLPDAYKFANLLKRPMV